MFHTVSYYYYYLTITFLATFMAGVHIQQHAAALTSKKNILCAGVVNYLAGGTRS